MKIIAQLSIMRSNAIPKTEFKRLRSLAGKEANTGDDYIAADYTLPSREFTDVLAALKKIGMTIWTDHQRMRRDDEFSVTGKLKFEESDVAASPYLHALPKLEFIDCTTESQKSPRVRLRCDSDNLAEMQRGTRKKFFAGELHLAMASFDYTIVSDHFKTEWEKGGFRGAEFGDDFVCTGPEAKKIKGKYWIFLPQKKVEQSEEPTDLLAQVRAMVGDESVAKEITRWDDRIALTRASVTAQEPFDIAQTAFVEDGVEKPGLLIGSQKFRSFCQKIGAEVDWRLVEVLRA